MRHTQQLQDLEFTPTRVKVTDWDLRLPVVPKAGPFCQLAVEATVSAVPGVYAWLVADKVIYIGHTDDLSLVSHNRGDFTSVTVSTVDTGPAKVNNLINAAFKSEHSISFWWRQEMSPGDAALAAGELVAEFDPMGNKLSEARPSTAPVAEPAAAAPAAARAKQPVRAPRYDAERVVPRNLVCPSCFIQVPLTTGWCDECEIKVTG